MANPTTIRGKVYASVYATLDASDLDGLTNVWPASMLGDPLVDNQDPNYPDDWTKWVVDTSAAEIVEAVLTADEHPSRADLLVLSGPYPCTLGGTKLSFKGNPGTVAVAADGLTYVPAFELSLEDVLWQIRNYARVSSVGEEYFFIDDTGILYFTGNPGVSLAKVYLGNYDIAWTVTDPLNTFPTSLLPALEAAILGRLFVQAGHKIQAGSYFEQRWTEKKAELMSGKVPERVNPFVKESA